MLNSGNNTQQSNHQFRRSYEATGALQIVAVGDATKIRDVLAKFGPIEEWDSDGHKVR